MRFILIIILLVFLSGCGAAPAKDNFEPTQSLTEDSLVYEFEDLDKIPKWIVKVQPKYAVDAASEKVIGRVRLSFVINEFGSPINIQVVESYPEGNFDDNAKRALSYWKARPGIKDGKSVLVYSEEEFIFVVE